jgi:hypothetical protein
LQNPVKEWYWPESITKASCLEKEKTELQSNKKLNEENEHNKLDKEEQENSIKNQQGLFYERIITAADPSSSKVDLNLVYQQRLEEFLKANKDNEEESNKIDKEQEKEEKLANTKGDEITLNDEFCESSQEEYEDFKDSVCAAKENYNLEDEGLSDKEEIEINSKSSNLEIESVQEQSEEVFFLSTQALTLSI